jgi:hypothetical protein
MTRKKALERWDTKVENFEVTSQAMWPIAKSFMKTEGPKAPTTLPGPLGITYHPKEKASLNAVWETCVMKTVNDDWRPEFKIYLHTYS